MNRLHKSKKIWIGTQNRIIIACLVLAIAGIVSTAPAISATSSENATSEESSRTQEFLQQEDGGPAQDQGTTDGGATETPSTVGPAPSGPTGVSNATGVAVGQNATTNTQQVVSSILNDVRASESNQTEIAQLEAVLPAMVNALTQVGGTPSGELPVIKFECVTTYDENGKRLSRHCTLTIGFS